MPHRLLLGFCSSVLPNSTIAIQVFDQKKFKKKGQGFLGVVNLFVGELALVPGRKGTVCAVCCVA